MMRIRPLTRADFDRVQALERDAGRAFHEVGMPDVARDEPPSHEELERARSTGCAYVAAAEDDAPIAFILTSTVDGAAHIDQVSVSPAYARAGIGASLIDFVASMARERGEAQITLTTFRDVPWNAPYYMRLGFTVLSEDHVGPGLRTVLDRERTSHPARAQRVAMRRSLG